MMQKTLKSVAAHALVLLLWLASAVVALAEIILGARVAQAIYVRAGGTTLAMYNLIFQVVALVLGLVALGFIIGSAEYHLTRAGQKGSWRLFAWSYGLELLLLILYFVLYL